MASPTVFPGGRRQARWASEQDLTIAWAGGDEDACAAAYERFWPELVVYLRGHVDCHADAEDLAQETWVRIERAMPRFDSDRRLWPWMSVVARRVAHTHYRRTHEPDGWPRVVVADVTVEAQARSEPDHGDAIVLREAVLPALPDLPPRQRAALLAAMSGLSAEEAAPSAGLDANGFRQLLYRARANLRRLLGREAIPAVLPLLWPRRVAHSVRGWLTQNSATGIAAGAAQLTVAVVLATSLGGPPPVMGLNGSASVAVDGGDASRGAATPELSGRHSSVLSLDDEEVHGAPLSPQASAEVAAGPGPAHPVVPLPAVAVPWTDVRGHQEPIDDPDYRFGAAVPVPGAPQTISVAAEDDPRTEDANAAACAVAATGEPLTFCERP